MNPLTHYSLAQLRRRPLRALLTLIGIALGVGSIVAISISTDTTRDAYREMFNALSGRATVEVVAVNQAGFSPEMVSTCSKARGVKAAVPVIQKPAALWTSSGPLAVLLLGIDPINDRAARDYVLKNGRLLDRDDGLLVEGSFAEANGLALGANARLMTTAGSFSIPVVGILEPKGAAVSATQGVLVTTLATARNLFKMSGEINAVHIVPDGSVSDADLERVVNDALPVGYVAQPPATRGALANESLRSTEQGLAALSVVSLVAGGFVVLNTFLMSLGERRRQFAILRSLGTTPRQLTALLLREALILGVLGTLLGVVIGIGFASGLTSGLEKIIGMKLSGPKFNFTPFAMAAVVGPGMSLLATWGPARQAARRPILQELLGTSATRSNGHRQWPSIAGAVLISVDLVILILFFNNYIPSQWLEPLIAPLMTGFLVGVVMVIPLLLTFLMNGTAALLGPVSSVEKRIALRQVRRRRGRTSLTVGVLTIAVVVTIGMGNTLLNNSRDISEWGRKVLAADFFVRSAMPNVGTLMTASLPVEMEEQLAALPGVSVIERLCFQSVKVNKERALLIARSYSPTRPLPLDLEGSDPDVVRDAIQRGEVVMGTVLARRLGLRVGDKITLPSRRGTIERTIAGLTTDYTVGGVVLYMDLDAARNALGLTGVDAFMVSAKEGQRPALDEAIRALAKEKGLHLQSNLELQRVVDDLVNSIVGFLWLLLIEVFVVALLGIVNTLTMNVLEQTRELGVMRAIAMTRGQVRRLIQWQALAMGLMSLVPGLSAGIGLAYLMNLSNSAIIGNLVPFRLNLGFTAICCLASLAVSYLASLPPAEHAARLTVTRALMYE